MSPEVLPCPAQAHVAIIAPLRHLCPYRVEVDQGEVHLSWTAAGSTLELHSLKAWLSSFGDTQVSHEALTDLIRRDLEGLEGITDLHVSTFWTTAGMDVKCSTSPIPSTELK